MYLVRYGLPVMHSEVVSLLMCTRVNGCLRILISVHEVHGFHTLNLCLRCRSKTGTSDRHQPECVIPDDVLIQFGPPDDEHLSLETCRGMK
jgi:hypothetical protein